MFGMTTRHPVQTALGSVVDLSAAGAGAPDWVHLLPIGVVPSRDGRPAWRNDASADVVSASLAAAGGLDLPIDYDHQIDLAAVPGVGGTARAAGWLKQLEVRADGIWGRVEWTAAASQAIAAREYRYLSPVFDHTIDDRRILRLKRAALTNNPALTLTALSHQQQQEVQLDPVLKAFLEALGLKPDTDQATALAHAQKLVASTAIVTALAAKLGVTETTETALAAAIDKAAKPASVPDPAQFAPIATVNALQTALATIQTERASEKATSVVETAMAAGKLIPAQKNWATAYAAKDLKGFEGWLAAAPVVTAAILTGGAPAKVPGDGSLTLEDTAICAGLGISVDDFKKTRAAEQEG